MSTDTVIVIPARLASTRLPRKLLLAETGYPLLQHTYAAARQARLASQVVVAADSAEIAAVVRDFGGEAVLTPPELPSGTDRVAYAVRRLPQAAIIVNVQGDEPELAGSAIDALIRLLQHNPTSGMATLATPIRRQESLLDPSCVKVVFDAAGRALYFSRSPIPHARDELLTRQPALFHQHLGIYAYRRDFLLQMAELAPSPLEQTEKLEQLRVLEAGCAILVGVVDEPTIGIDTPEDYRRFVERWKQSGRALAA